MGGKSSFSLAIFVLIAAVTIQNGVRAAPTESTEGPTDTPYTKPTEIPDTIPKSCAERPAENDYLMIPDPTNCTKFIVCYGEQEASFTCPSELYFSYEEQICEWPWNTRCVESTETTSEAATEFTDESSGDGSTEGRTDTSYTKPTEIPDGIPKSCAERPKENDYLMIPDPTTCTKFIVCYGEREATVICPSGLYFNYEEQICDWPRNTHCVEHSRNRSLAFSEQEN